MGPLCRVEETGGKGRREEEEKGKEPKRRGEKNVPSQIFLTLRPDRCRKHRGKHRIVWTVAMFQF